MGRLFFVGVPNYKVGSGVNQGMVKVYRRSILTNQYEFMQNITASDGVAGDKFGYSLDATTFYGDCADVDPYSTVYLVVGAPNKNSNRGCIYLYRYDYVLDQFIVVTNSFSSSDGTANDNYGYALTILQGSNPIQVLVGAPLKTVNGLFANGRAYIVGFISNFTHPCTSSLLTGFYEANILNMKSNAANSYFGSAVATGKKRFVGGAEDVLYAVGASFRNVNANANQGIVYMFRNGSGSIILPGFYDSIVVASDGNSLDYFGNAISIGGYDGTVAIAANYKESGANASQGVVYIFRDTSNVIGTRWWVQKNKFTAPDGNAGDHFGSSMEWQGDILMVGSSNRDDGAVDAGAVYIYQQIPYQLAGMRFKKKIIDALPQAGAMMGKSISQTSTSYVFGVPDWDEPGKTDVGKIIIGEIFY
jgi:FG-GAP repeat